jgi:hypothetical protein
MLVIHGKNQVASREQFISLKKQEILKNKQILELSGSAITLSQLKLLIQSGTLFGDSASIFIQDFFSARSSGEKKLIISFLLTKPETSIYFWDGKDVSDQLKDFSAKLILKFDLPRSVFNFLDTLSISDLYLSLKTAPSEQILYLLINHLHSLILAKEHLGNFSGWKSAKLNKQSAKYSLPQLTKLYLDFINIDYGNKTSSVPYNLDSALELWVSRL